MAPALVRALMVADTAEVLALRREKRLAEMERLRLEKTVANLRAFIAQQGRP